MKDKIKELIDAKAERVAKNKIEELRKYLEREFPYELHSAMFNAVGFWTNKKYPESKELYEMFLAKVKEDQERDFFNKIESVFYNLEN